MRGSNENSALHLGANLRNDLFSLNKHRQIKPNSKNPKGKPCSPLFFPAHLLSQLLIFAAEVSIVMGYWKEDVPNIT